MRIRRASREDVAAIRRVIVRAHDLCELLLGYEPEAASADLHAWIGRDALFVGERASEVMAALFGEKRDGQWFIYSAVVDPDWQGEGHGRALLEHAEALGRDQGCGEARLSTNSLLHRSISLYRHCGYRVTGVRPHPSQPGHQFTDLAKPL